MDTWRGNSYRKLAKLPGSPTGIEAIGIVPDREDWVTDHHTRSGVTHDMAHPLPHGRLIAMYGTLGASRFLCMKGAFVDTFHCIGKQLQTVGAKLMGSMMTPTVNFNHKANGFTLPVQTPLSLWVMTRFINHRADRLPYPFLQVPEKVRRTAEAFFL